MPFGLFHFSLTYSFLGQRRNGLYKKGRPSFAKPLDYAGAEYMEELFSSRKPASELVYFRASKKQCAYQLRHLLRSGFSQAQRFWEEDLYFSPMSFKNGSSERVAGNAYALYALAIDVDFKKSWNNESADPEAFYWDVLSEEVGRSVPVPTWVEMSHCLRLVYVLSDPLYLCGKAKEAEALKRAARCTLTRFCRELNDRLDVSAEPQALNSFFRFPGSKNTKDGSTVRVLKVGEKTTLAEMMEYLPDLPLWYGSWKEKRRRKRKGHRVPSSIRSVLAERAEALRSAAPSWTGPRYMFLWHYANALANAKAFGMWDGSVLDEALALNSQLPNPLPEREVASKLGSAVRTGKYYRYTNARIAEDLGGGVAIQRASSRGDGLSRRRAAEERYAEFLRLREKGATLAEAAKALGCSLSLCKKHSQRHSAEQKRAAEERRARLRERSAASRACRLEVQASFSQEAKHKLHLCYSTYRAIRYTIFHRGRGRGSPTRFASPPSSPLAIANAHEQPSCT